MAAERLPYGLGVAVVVGGSVLMGLGIAVPKGAPESAPGYARQTPAVDVARIGVESRVSHANGGGRHGGGMEGTIAHAAEHTSVESSVFASPGGRYTAEDIARNGTVPPAKKFEGIVSVHDMHPERGTAVCPVTMTKANPAFTWWVGGKRYAFCCPPCVEEWVMKAKASKTPLPPPESFVAK